MVRWPICCNGLKNENVSKSTKMATGVAILRIFYDILHVLISFETLFQSI